MLYVLKRKFAYPIAVYLRLPDQVDLETGRQNLSEVKYTIRRAIVLPFSVYAKLFQKIADFKYGGDLDVERRVFIIDRADLPVVISDDKFSLVFDGRRYGIEKLENFERDAAYVVVGKRVTNPSAPEQVDVVLHDWLFLSDGVT